MINPKLLRNQPELIAQKLLDRNFLLDVKLVKKMEKKRKLLQIKVENLQFKHNNLSNEIAKIIVFKDKNIIQEKIFVLKKKIKDIMIESKKCNLRLNILKENIYNFSMLIPNLPDESIPKKQDVNREILRWGDIKNYDFVVKDHILLGNQISGFDWNASAQLSGTRFMVMKGKIALLYRVLGQFMLDLHTKNHGYLETYVPYLVHSDILYGTGQLPKFDRDLFHVTSSDQNNFKKNFYLIPTAEVPLTNLFRNQILSEDKLPILLTANTPCFRSEASSYGRDVKGLMRTHQFDKVELVQITHPDYSMNALEQLTLHAENVLRLLKLPYRKVLLSAKEMGFSATKTYDLEVWMPSKSSYTEVSSCSNMSDFQSRRMKTRFNIKHKNKNFLVHTINGSGLAIGRTLAAVLENYQLSDGRIQIPEILQKNYMNNLKYID